MKALCGVMSGDDMLETPTHRVRRTRTPQELSEPKASGGGKEEARVGATKAANAPSASQISLDAKQDTVKPQPAQAKSAPETASKEPERQAVAHATSSGKGKGGQLARPAQAAVKQEPESLVRTIKQEPGVKEDLGVEARKARRAAAKTAALKAKQEAGDEEELEFPEIPPEPAAGKVKPPDTPSTVQRQTAMRENLQRGDTQQSFPATPRDERRTPTASPVDQPDGTTVPKRRQRRPKTMEEKRQHALYMRFSRAITGQVYFAVIS